MSEVEEKIKSEGSKTEDTPTKEDSSKTETKKEEEDSKPKVENIPLEPEEKIPSDFTSEINELTNLKNEGNSLIKNDLDSALEKYESAFQKSEEIMKKATKERDYNPQVKDLDKIIKQITSNLAVCYLKKKEYEKCIEKDIIIISKDQNYDKSYVRLFQCYKELGNLDNACYFGLKLKYGFDEDTKAKYKNEIEEISKLEEEMKKKYEDEIAKQKKEFLKKLAKYIIPVIVLIGSILYYFLVIKKRKK